MAWNFILYLLYGLAFFTLGVAILSRDIRFSELGIARIIRLLALFGIIHGFHEWLELLEHLDPGINTPPFALFRLTVVSISFLFLLYFGIFLNIITYYGDQALKTTPRMVKALIGVSALSLILVVLYYDLGTGKDINTRSFVAFPGGLLSGIGLVMSTPGDINSHTFKVILPQRTVELGDKQPNSCNLCHYHKNDKPEDLARVLDSIKEKSWGKYKITP